MFKFITQKYEKKIAILTAQIENMLYEWRKEKELYNDKMNKKVLEQKVDFVIGGIDMKMHKEIHRPLYGLTSIEAYEVAYMVKKQLKEQNILSSTSFHWRERTKCFVIDVKVIDFCQNE